MVNRGSSGAVLCKITGLLHVIILYHCVYCNANYLIFIIVSLQENLSPIELYKQLLVTISEKDDLVKAVKLLASGAPLQVTQDIHSDALVLAVSCNRPRIVTLLVAAGAPLTTITSGLSLLEVAWLSPDVTIRVKVLIARVSIYIQMF